MRGGGWGGGSDARSAKSSESILKLELTIEPSEPWCEPHRFSIVVEVKPAWLVSVGWLEEVALEEVALRRRRRLRVG